MFHPGATQTNAGAKFERRCCLGSVALVISPPASTSRADGRNVGEEIERIATSTAAPLRLSTAAVAGLAKQTDARTSYQRSRLYCGVAIVISPAELTANGTGPVADQKSARSASRALLPRLFFRRKCACRRKKYRQQQKNWTGCHVGSAASVNSPRDLVARPEKTPTSSKHSNQPSAVTGPWPVVFARLHFFIRAARRSEVAI